MEFEVDAETRMLRREVRRVVDEEFRPLLDNVQDRIERYHELDPGHADLTDYVRPHPIPLE